MKKILIIALLSFSSLSFGQLTKFSVEASYPLPVDQNFVGDHFKGVADLGVKYRIKNLRIINFGLSLNASLLNYNDTGYFPAYDETLDFKTNLYIIQPRFFAELNLKGLTKLRPSAGIGYSFFIANTEFDSETNIADERTTESGVNTNIGLSYDILKKVYIFASYDYTIITNLESDVPKTDYNTKANLVKIGVGIRL
jgi:hypothetical protein